MDNTIHEKVALSVDKIKKATEALLFAHGEPVSYQKLADLFGIAVSQIKSITSNMSDEYENRGIQLVCYESACQLCTKEEYESLIKDALGIKKNGALSNSSLETLAVIAYNQPVTRAFVEEVRGVDSSYAFNLLLQRDLIEIKGRLDVPGKPNLYATTNNFLRVFGLNSIKDLPEVEILNTNANKQEPKQAASE